MKSRIGVPAGVASQGLSSVGKFLYWWDSKKRKSAPDSPGVTHDLLGGTVAAMDREEGLPSQHPRHCRPVYL